MLATTIPATVLAQISPTDRLARMDGYAIPVQLGFSAMVRFASLVIGTNLY
jgi:hypothetical protein